MQQFNKQLLQFSATSEDMILAQEELANDAATLRFEDNKTAMLLQANNASLTKKADNIRKAQIRKISVIDRLEEEIISQEHRELFQEDLKDLRDVKGYYFFTRLRQIFKHKTILNRILYLNNEILRRNDLQQLEETYKEG